MVMPVIAGRSVKEMIAYHQVMIESNKEITKEYVY
jgi:hypothetical protein